MKHAAFSLPLPTSKARCARDLVFEEVLDFLGYSMDNPRERGKTLRMLKGKRPSEIRALMSTAKQEGKNPPALFIHLCQMRNAALKI